MCALNAHFVRIRVLRVEALCERGSRDKTRNVKKRPTAFILRYKGKRHIHPSLIRSFSLSRVYPYRGSLFHRPSLPPRPLPARLDRQAKRDRAPAIARDSRKCSNYGNYNAPSYTDGLSRAFFSENGISLREIVVESPSNPAERGVFLNCIPIEIIYRFNRT